MASSPLGPAGRYSLYRVTFKEQTDTDWLWTARAAPTEAEARQIFSQVEKALRTIEQRENRLRVHIDPVWGDLPVATWRLAHSRRVIEGAKARGLKSVGRPPTSTRTWPPCGSWPLDAMVLALVGAPSGGRRRRRGQSGVGDRQGGGSVLRLLTKLTLSREIWVRASSWLIAGVPSPGCGP